MEGEEEAITKVSYFKGNDRSKWKSDIPTYGLVTMSEVYKGIGFKLRTNGKNVEKLFFVKPGAEPGKIRMKVSGAQSLRTNDKGELEVETGLGTLVFTKPRAYQIRKNITEEVQVAYVVDGKSYGFKVAEYDKMRELVIDPLIQATYLGGNAKDRANVIAVSGSNVYVTGQTGSVNFPGTEGGAQSVSSGGGYWHVFVALLSPDLKTLIQATYLGGNGSDEAWAIAVSGSNVYVAGDTLSTDFPGTAGGAQPVYGGSGTYGGDAFVALLSSDLKTLTQATYLGGSDNDSAFAIAVSGSNVYVSGRTFSTDFPGTAGGFQSAYSEGFVALLSSDLKALTQATYFGDSGDQVAVSGSNVYVTSATASTKFPGSAGGAQSSYGGGLSDAIIALLSPDLKTLIQSTYLGGNGWDGVVSIAVTDSNVYVAGGTSSTNFPGTAGGAQPSYGGGNQDGFVTLLSPDLKTLIQASYIGGNGWEYAYVAVSGSNVYVSGHTSSTDLPGTAGGAQQSYGGGSQEVFVDLLSHDLKTLIQATYLGGNDDDTAYATAVSGSNVYIAGYTASTNFPGTAGGAQPVKGGGYDAFVALLTGKLSACDSSLTASRAPSSGGIVNGTGLNCPGTCSASYYCSENITLTAVANIGYEFSNWTDCDVSSGVTCNLTMATDKNVIANFVSCPVEPSRRAGTVPVYKSSIQDVYDDKDTGDGDTIEAQSVVFDGSLNFTRNILIDIQGGYNCSFSTKVGNAVIHGPMTISAGAVVLGNLTLQ